MIPERFKQILVRTQVGAFVQLKYPATVEEEMHVVLFLFAQTEIAGFKSLHLPKGY